MAHLFQIEKDSFDPKRISITVVTRKDRGSVSLVPKYKLDNGKEVTIQIQTPKMFTPRGTVEQVDGDKNPTGKFMTELVLDSENPVCKTFEEKLLEVDECIIKQCVEKISYLYKNNPAIKRGDLTPEQLIRSNYRSMVQEPSNEYADKYDNSVRIKMYLSDDGKWSGQAFKMPDTRARVELIDATDPTFVKTQYASIIFMARLGLYYVNGNLYPVLSGNKARVYPSERADHEFNDDDDDDDDNDDYGNGDDFHQQSDDDSE